MATEDSTNVEALRGKSALDITNPVELRSLNGFIGPDPHEASSPIYPNPSLPNCQIS